MHYDQIGGGRSTHLPGAGAGFRTVRLFLDELRSLLGRISVPVLLVSGRYDEATPATVRPYADRIPDVRWQIYDNSSHMPHIEEATASWRASRSFSTRATEPARQGVRARVAPAASVSR